MSNAVSWQRPGLADAAYDKASDLALPSCLRGQLISCGRGFGVDQGSDRRIAA
jgi:hypothetical protein